MPDDALPKDAKPMTPAEQMADHIDSLKVALAGVEAASKADGVDRSVGISTLKAQIAGAQENLESLKPATP